MAPAPSFPSATTRRRRTRWRGSCLRPGTQSGRAEDEPIQTIAAQSELVYFWSGLSQTYQRGRPCLDSRTVPSVERLAPSYNVHPVFDEPPSDTVLWRYMDLSRFLALLERRALYMSAVSRFSDPFEGTMTHALRAQVEARGKNHAREWASWRIATYVNCWNQDIEESVALWSMYSTSHGGVAIRSSVGAIKSALDPNGGSRGNELYIGRVRYVDFDTVTMPEDNTLWPVVHKRLPYRFEQEIRVVMWARTLVWYAQGEAESAGREWPDVLRKLVPPGFDVAIEPNALVQAVVVAPDAPDWLLELVRALAARYGLAASVERSRLDAPPALLDG